MHRKFLIELLEVFSPPTCVSPTCSPLRNPFHIIIMELSPCFACWVSQMRHDSNPLGVSRDRQTIKYHPFRGVWSLSSLGNEGESHRVWDGFCGVETWILAFDSEALLLQNFGYGSLGLMPDDLFSRSVLLGFWDTNYEGLEYMYIYFFPSSQRESSTILFRYHTKLSLLCEPRWMLLLHFASRWTGWQNFTISHPKNPLELGFSRYSSSTLYLNHFQQSLTHIQIPKTWRARYSLKRGLKEWVKIIIILR